MDHNIIDETKRSNRLAEKRRALRRQHATSSDSTVPSTKSPVSPTARIYLSSPPPQSKTQVQSPGTRLTAVNSPSSSVYISTPVPPSSHRGVRSPLPSSIGTSYRSCTPYRSNESMLSIKHESTRRKKVCLKNSSRPSLRNSSRALSADCRSPTSSTENRLYIQRQKTTESVPTYMSSHMISWNSSRQQSLSQGPSRMTLIRGESCSLVDIPTYISSSIELGCISSPPMQVMMNRPARPRLQIDLTKRKPVKKAKEKTRWTVVCVSVIFMCMCIGLVGTMLSITTEYQV